MPNTPQANDPARRRWTIYWLLIALAVGQSTGRLMAVNSIDLERIEANRINKRLDEFRDRLQQQGKPADEVDRLMADRRTELREKLRLERPFLSSNDRSRWLAIRALVEHGTFAIDEVLKEPTWDSIDMVQHPNRAGVPRLYSSKPPLLATLLAGEYWIIHKLTGATLGTHPYAIGRAMLFTINILPMALMLWLIAATVERVFDQAAEPAIGDWPRLFIVAAAAFGTMLAPFVVVLNNHLVAAVSVSIVLYAWARIRIDDDLRLRWFALAGLAAAFTAATELPALALLVFLCGWLMLRHPGPTLKAFVPAAMVVVGAFFATNYAAHNTLAPPYMHRSEKNPEDNWYQFTYERNGRERTSYWSNPTGIDRGEPSRAVYAWHVLVGHHGIFSLTPVWLLSFAGMGMWLARSDSAKRELAALTLALSVICLVFYIVLREQVDRNYGGMTSGFRWMFWFAPLWLTTMAPAVGWLSRKRLGRGIALLVLALSAMSAAYPTWNPWTQPWIYNLLEYLSG